MPIDELKTTGCRWIHINGVDEKAIEYLKNNYKFHTLDLEDVASEQQRPKVDIYKYYLFLICVFPYFDNEKMKMRGYEVNIFLNKDVLITVSKKNYPLLNNLHRRLSENAKLRKMWMSKGPSFLVYKILEKLYKDSHSAIEVVGERISDVEDNVYDNSLKNVAHDLALIRRSVLALRRMLDPQRFAMNTLVSLDRDFIPSDMSNYFDNVHDHIEKVWMEVENYRDTIDGLHWTSESLISQHTNRIITILTVLSASLMPLTLLAGFYGMNLIKLPYAEKPYIVFSLFGAVAVLTVFLVALIFRSKRSNF